MTWTLINELWGNSKITTCLIIRHWTLFNGGFNRRKTGGFVAPCATLWWPITYNKLSNWKHNHIYPTLKQTEEKNLKDIFPVPQLESENGHYYFLETLSIVPLNGQYRQNQRISCLQNLSKCIQARWNQYIKYSIAYMQENIIRFLRNL